jgi:hypothetical protein
MQSKMCIGNQLVEDGADLLQVLQDCQEVRTVAASSLREGSLTPPTGRTLVASSPDHVSPASCRADGLAPRDPIHTTIACAVTCTIQSVHKCRNASREMVEAHALPPPPPLASELHLLNLCAIE